MKRYQKFDTSHGNMAGASFNLMYRPLADWKFRCAMRIAHHEVEVNTKTLVCFCSRCGSYIDLKRGIDG